jgi:hypothetical protein
VLLDGGGTVAGVKEASARDSGLHRRSTGEFLRRRGGTGIAQRGHRSEQALLRCAFLDKEPHALGDHGDRRDAEAEQEPQHPARAGTQHEVEELAIDGVLVHGVS